MPFLRSAGKVASSGLRTPRIGGIVPVIMWMIYAIAAAFCWGLSYAASGVLLKKGVGPMVFFAGYSLFCAAVALSSLIFSGSIPSALRQFASCRADAGWFFLSVGVGALGAYLTYAAMSAKNPTLVSLIEISYPLFVIFFTWVLFRQFQLNSVTILGALLIMTGVAILVLGERGSE